MFAGLAASLPHTLSSGLIAQGITPGTARQIAALPPISVLFASFLGYNPIGHLVGSNILQHLPAAKAAALTSRGFLPGLLAGPFRSGLHIAFGFSIACCLIAAAASWSRGSLFVPEREPGPAAKASRRRRPGSGRLPGPLDPAASQRPPG